MAKAKELQELKGTPSYRHYSKGVTWTVGMEVFIQSDRHMSIRPISRITDGRGGTIYVGESAYDKSGRKRASGDWHFGYISPATDKDRAIIVGKNNKAKLERFKWSSLTPEQATEIITLLTKESKSYNSILFNVDFAVKV